LTRFGNRRAAVLGRPFFWVLAGAAALALWLVLRPGRAPNVVVISIDTLRADALGPEDTPELMALAARGTRFVRARTPAPLPLPAPATLLPGLEPPAHGLRDNTVAPLAPDLPHLAEELRARGYATAAFVASAVLDPRYGLDRGFDQYRAPPPVEPGAPGFDFLQAPAQVERVRAWLATRPQDRPFFLWVHLWDPHAPYLPYAGDARRPGTVETDDARERYRGEVRRADAAVEALLALLDPETTVVVVVADHGESLGEHGEETHGHLCYGATMDVPLLLAGPGVPAGRTEDGVCGLADVAPTVRRLCGLAPARTDGRDLLDLPAGRILAGESLYAWRLYRWAQQSVAYDGRFSLVDGGPRLELFDRAEDPGELAPLAGPEARPEYAPLDRALQAYRGRRTGASAGAELQAPLYYGIPVVAGRDFLPVAENRRLPDAGPRLKSVRLLSEAASAIAARNRPLVQALVPRLLELEGADPGNPAPCLARGRALLFVLGDAAGAARALEEAVARGYASPDVYRLLEEACTRAGDAEGAARARALAGVRKK